LSEDELIALIQYHTVDQALDPAALATQDYPTLLSGETVAIAATSPPTINGIVFVAQAVATTSGFLYEIQGVLTPPSP
jgi:uncharacterized surface protein with fasciclin (FAS1) repeats